MSYRGAIEEPPKSPSSDHIGKSLPAYKMLFTVDTLIAPALLHLLFIPLFVVVASSGPVADAAGADAAPLLALITSDQFAFFLVSALGISTGYITCSAMMLGCSPDTLNEADHVSAGNVMVNCLMVGLCAGSFVGMGLSVIS